MDKVQEKSAKRRCLSPGERRLVLKVESYFTKEKENMGPLASVLAVQKRTCDACDILEKTLRRIENMDEQELDQVNKRSRRCPKTIDLPEGTKLTIKNIIYDMYKAKKYVTRDAILQKIKDKELCDIGKTSLSIVLKNMGFRYKSSQIY